MWTLQHSSETAASSFGRNPANEDVFSENGEELNHFYVMEVYRDWRFVHDIGGWDGIILDYSKQCEVREFKLL